MATKMTNLFAAVKKPFKSKSDKYEQSESEAKVNYNLALWINQLLKDTICFQQPRINSAKVAPARHVTWVSLYSTL